MATIEQLITVAQDLEEQRSALRAQRIDANKAGDLDWAAELAEDDAALRAKLRAVNEQRAAAEAALLPPPAGNAQALGVEGVASQESVQGV